MLATVAGGCSFGLAKSFGVGRLMGGAVLVGPALAVGLGLAIGLVLGAGLELGVTALATSARIKLTKSMVSNFVIFMEGPFFGWKKKQGAFSGLDPD